MAQDPKQPKPPSGSAPSRPGPTTPARPVPFERSFAAGGKAAPVPSGDLSEDDLRDIDDLLGQEQDVTRQDIPAQNFQGLLDRYTRSKKDD